MPLASPLEHPARYSHEVLPVIARFLNAGALVLDPFAGTGERHAEINHVKWVRLEIEEGWADMVQGDALKMPFRSGTFDSIATSPTYGSRMADHHKARDTSTRITYRHKLGRMPRPTNSGVIQWGDKYQRFHREAYAECKRVLKPGGRFVLNVSDHIRKFERVPVTKFHFDALRDLGFELMARQEVFTRRPASTGSSLSTPLQR